MLEDFLTWVQLLNQAVQQSQAVTNQKLSNLIFIAYLLTIRKSYLFGMAFLLCECTAMVNLVPINLDTPIYGLTFYCAMLLTWLMVAGLHVIQTNNRNTLIACVTMILFLLYMEWDSYINAYTETLVWRHYENIIVLIHAAIIASLYRDKFIFDRLVDEFVRAVGFIRLNVYRVYFWYTVKKINQGE